MPRRLLREGILRSKRVNSLSIEAELFYRRLMSVVDDYGRYEFDSEILLSYCYPRNSRGVCVADVMQMLRACASTDPPLIVVYENGGSKYLEITDFKQITRTASKFPEPTESQMITIGDADATHLVHNVFGGVGVYPEAEAETKAHQSSIEDLVFIKPQRKKRTPISDPRFAEFWGEYWRKIARKPAMALYGRLIQTDELHAMVMKALRDQKPGMMVRDPSGRPHATTWLNQERWNDEPEIPAVNGTRKNRTEQIFEDYDRRTSAE